MLGRGKHRDRTKKTEEAEAGKRASGKLTSRVKKKKNNDSAFCLMTRWPADQPKSKRAFR